MPDLPHGSKACLFVIGVMETLIRRGFVSGEPNVTPRGVAAYDQLKASGYRPTRDEVRIVLDVNDMVPKDQLDLVTKMIEAQLKEESHMLREDKNEDAAGKARPSKPGKLNRDDAIKIAGAAAAAAAANVFEDTKSSKAARDAARKAYRDEDDEDGDGEDRIAPSGLRRPLSRRYKRPSFMDAIPEALEETVAQVTWPGGSVRLVRRTSGAVSIEGDLVGAPRWALQAITEAARGGT